MGLIQIDSGNNLLPHNTKPLPEIMLTYHQRCSVAFTKEQFQNGAHELNLQLVFESYMFEITITSPRVNELTNFK